MVAYPISRGECKLTQELFCRTGNGYHYTTLGFNMADAGVGVDTSKVDQSGTVDAKVL